MTREELLNIIETDHVQCGEAAALARMALAFYEWHDKTAWVQTDKRFDVLTPWGRHRADVLKEYIEHLENRIAMDSEPVALHMSEAINVFNALKIEQLSEHVNNARLGPMGASNVQVWTSKAGGRLEFISTNGGCTLNIFPHPAPVVPDEMTPEMMRAVQLNSDLGAYATANLSGAYGLFAEFWKVAFRAAMLAAAKQEVK